MAADNPIVGVGHNAYNVTYDRYDTSNGAFGTGRSVHSIWFGVLAELGYPGLLLFFAQILLGFRAASRARRAAELNPAYGELKKYAFGIEAALGVFAVGGSFVPLQYNEMMWHVVGLSIVLNRLASEALAAAETPTPAAAISARDWQPAAAAS